MKKVLGILKRIVDIVVFAVIVLFVLAICLQRFSNNELSIFNYRLFTVITGSMVPEYNVGDVLISKEIEPNDVKVGDDVSYLGKSGTFNGKVVTHRVVKIEKDVDGNLVFYTKGLANLIEDPAIFGDQIYGKVVGEAKILSLVYKCVSNPTGMFIFIVIPLLYVVGSEMIHFLLEKEENRRKKIKKEHDDTPIKEVKAKNNKKK